MAGEAYTVTCHFWQVVDHWQTLIAGLLAVCAAAGTILVTLRAAKIQAQAALNAADREVQAISDQNARLLEGEARRQRMAEDSAKMLAKESLKFLRTKVEKRISEYRTNPGMTYQGGQDMLGVGSFDLRAELGRDIILLGERSITAIFSLQEVLKEEKGLAGGRGGEIVVRGERVITAIDDVLAGLGE